MMKRFLMLISIGLILSVSLTFAAGGGQQTTGANGKITITTSGMGWSGETNGDPKVLAETMSYGDLTYAMRRIAIREQTEQKYPQYNWEWVDNGWAENLDAKQRSLIAAGMPPATVTGEAFMSDYAEAGLLQEIPASVLQGINPSFILRALNGKPYAVAYESSTFMLFYNKDLLAKAGLDPNKPPTTWDEWKEMSRIITEKGNGQYWGGGVPSFPHDGGAFRATPFFRQLGTDIGKDGKANLNDPKVQQALQFIREMNAYLPPGLGNANEEDPLWNAFEKEGQQNIAFVVDGTWREATASRVMNMGVAPLPLPAGGVPGNCLVGTIYLGIPVGISQEVTTAVWDVIKTIVLSVEACRYTVDNGRLPSTQSVLENSTLFQRADQLSLRVGVSDLLSGTYSGLYAFPKNSSQVREIFNQQVLARTTMTNDPIAAICSQAQARMEALLK
jgi:ABC-type glycerol-3-phosphate transport system substrate-binding protein